MNSTFLRRASALVGLLLAGGLFEATSAQTPVDQEAEAQALMQLSRAWADSVAAGKLDATIDFWADDAIMMAPGQPPLRGKAAIRDFVMASAEISGFHITWEPLEAHVSGCGDMAYLVERNEITAPDSTGALVTIHNKVVTVWKRQEDGSWKNVVDMWNADPTPR